MARAGALMQEKRYAEAETELERALRYDPNHPEIHRMLARLHWQAGNVARAEDHAQRALDGNPDDAAAHYTVGRCRVERGDIPSAITAYRTALRCSDVDRHPETMTLCYKHLADALVKEGYLQAALEQYSRFEEHAALFGETVADPELATIMRATGGSTGRAKSQILERLGRFADAADALQPLVDPGAEDPQDAVRHARLLMLAGKTNAALAAARAIEANSDSVIALLVEIHERAGHPEGVVEELRSRSGRRPDDPDLLLSLVDSLIQFGRWDEARAELRRFLELHPNATAAQTRLLVVLAKQHAWIAALDVSADAIHRHPQGLAEIQSKLTELAAGRDALAQLLRRDEAVPSGDTETAYAKQYLRGILALSADQLDNAEYWLKESHATNPEFIATRVTLARLYLRQRRYDEALKVAARGNEDEPEHAELERVLGDIHERLDDLDQAALHYRAATQLDRNDPDSMFALAEIHRHSRRVLQAQRQLQVLLEQAPEHERAREVLGFLYLQDGKVDAAFEQFEKLKELAVTPTTKARVGAALKHFPPSDPVAYRAALLEAIEQHGTDARTWVAVADTYDEFTEAEKLYEAYAQALQLDPENEEAALGLVRADRSLLRFEQAGQRLAKLLPVRPNRHSWRNLLISINWVIQDYDAALALAREQLARGDLPEADQRGYRLALIDTLRFAGRSAEALKQLQTWSNETPENWEWAARLAEAYVRDNQAIEAVAILEGRCREHPENRDALGALAESLVAGGQTDRAAQYALDWLKEDPDNDEALALLVSIVANGNRVGDAIELVRNKLLRTMNREVFQNQLIALWQQSGQLDQGIYAIERLLDEVVDALRSVEDPGFRQPAEEFSAAPIAFRPNEPYQQPLLVERLTNLRLRLALSLIVNREYREAEEKLRDWLEMSRAPGVRFRYLYTLAQCFQQQGQDVKASETLERASLLQPDNVTINNDLAYWWIDRGERLDDAEPLIRFAVWRSPREGAYLDTYGWLMYKKGQFAEARKWLERAEGAIGRRDPVVFDHLGDMYWRLGMPEEAIEHWKGAVEAAGQLDEDEITGADVRRVRAGTQAKIDAAGAGAEPRVAPLGEPPDTIDPDN
ncbi:MAG: tetratricopeptide repeat protein [Planctomycetes bacterium]|nr:tetratricopeptide repeat protein [Planctomycetota bacterium]